MPGGSLLSAPFVDKLLPSERSDRKLVLNYWYRHIWEYFYPLYSGMAWIITVMKVEPLSILCYMAPMSLIMVAAGIPLIRRTPRETPPGLATDEKAHRLLLIGWPILFAVTISLAGLPLWLSVIAAVAAFVAVNRRLAQFVLPYLFSKKTIFTIFMTAGIVYFERIVREAGVATAIYQALQSYNAEVVVFTLSLIIGLLTGISIAFISIVFPIISPFLITGGVVDMPLLTFAYAGGFTGVMLSPTHLCLIVTTDFFKTRLVTVYPAIVRAGIFMALGGGIYYAFLRMVT
jgi:integral membrane protein (TIGR00529 family)